VGRTGRKRKSASPSPEQRAVEACVVRITGFVSGQLLERFAVGQTLCPPRRTLVAHKLGLADVEHRYGAEAPDHPAGPGIGERHAVGRREDVADRAAGRGVAMPSERLTSATVETGRSLHITTGNDLRSGGLAMATNLALDDRLIEEARRIGRHKT
jgi:hypothetical protein